MRSFREISNVNVGTLNAAKNKHIVKYDASTNQFSLTDPDVILSGSAASGDISDSFVDQVEAKVDTTKMTLSNVDGGSF